jgi:hypothetical protein
VQNSISTYVQVWSQNLGFLEQAQPWQIRKVKRQHDLHLLDSLLLLEPGSDRPALKVAQFQASHPSDFSTVVQIRIIWEALLPA